MLQSKAALSASTRRLDRLRRWRWIAGAYRFVDSLALEERRDWWRAERGRFNFASQCRELTEPRTEVDWLATVLRHALQQALRISTAPARIFLKGIARSSMPRKSALKPMEKHRIERPVETGTSLS